MASPSAPPKPFDLRRLRPPLPLPPGQNEQALQDLFASIELEGAPKRGELE